MTLGVVSSDLSTVSVGFTDFGAVLIDLSVFGLSQLHGLFRAIHEFVRSRACRKIRVLVRDFNCVNSQVCLHLQNFARFLLVFCLCFNYLLVISSLPNFWKSGNQ